MDESNGIELEHIGLDLNIETASSMYIMMTFAEESALARMHNLHLLKDENKDDPEMVEKCNESLAVCQAVLEDSARLKPEVARIMKELDTTREERGLIKHVDPAKAKLYATRSKG